MEATFLDELSTLEAVTFEIEDIVVPDTTSSIRADLCSIAGCSCVLTCPPESCGICMNSQN